VTGGGADIWDRADAFRYVYRTLSGDGVIVARVASLNGSDDWTKAGVMVRASLDANAAHASMFATVGNGLAFQRRPSTGALSTHTSGPSQGAPQWVRLVRSGNSVTASVSPDGSQWTVVGTDTVTLPSTVFVGLAVTSHNASTTATAAFDSVNITESSEAGQSLPDGWTSQDLGAVGVVGSATISGGSLQVQGAGADIWGTADAFHFVYRTLPGDGDIIARVSSVSGTDEWTKAGIMMRMTVDAGSPNAFMLASLSKGLAFQRRTVAGGDSTSTSSPGAAPRWMRLTRQGTLIVGSISDDGVNWTEVGRDTLSIAGSIEVGLAVTNHDSSRLATALFDNIQVIER
jgi:regulation of enolase protein 1 (concanavalin A-like superfamily)